jgi:hypothetical protein
MSISSLLHGQAYQWSNFVGNPGGLGHVDGPAAQARFYAPRGMAFDTAGNLFVADMLNHCIRRITPARVVSTFAGKAGVEGAADGAGGNARFKEPSAVVFVGGVLYVADSGNHTIRRITSTGVVSTLAGMVGVNGIANGTGVAARFRNPFGIARAVDGALLVLDSYNHTLRKVTTTGVVTTVAGQAGMAGSADGSLTEARFDHPFGLAVAADGTIFIADTRNHTIRKITPAGVVSTLAGSPGVSGMADGTGSAAMFDYPDALVLHPNGDLYVADANNCVIRKVTQAGVVTTVAGAFQQYGDADGIGTAARFQYPQGLVLDSAGRLLIADWDNHNIRRMSADLAVTTLAGPADSIGSADGMGKNARFYLPYGTSVAPSGDVFIADLANYKVRRASAGGVVTTYAGTGSFGSVDGPVATASLGYVYDTAVDAAGNVYVSDSSRTIRKIDTAGMVTTLAGTAGASGATDGMGAAARFTSPRGIAVTADGTVYVADEFAHTIRKISPAGEVTTLAGQANAGGHVNAAGAAARFFQPTDVDVDADGNVFVADSRNHRIRKISPAGEVTTVAGSGVYGNADGVGAEASFRSPTGVSLDPYGNVIVCDTFNHTLRRITPAGVVTTIGGSPLTPNANDGPDTVARFSRPMRAGIDSAGMVYVADSKNNRVMRGVPHPEIAVEEPVGIDLKDGTAVSDFGMVSIHEDVVKTFTIKSVGGAALTGLSVGVTGAHAADFEVQALAMSTLNPGYDMTFTVTYKGNVAGVRTAALKITSNDASEASFDIGLKAAAADRPVVTTAPASQVANEGDTVTFNAQGTHPNATVKFQWLKNGAKISGATAPTYQKTGLKVADAGTYTVEMTTNGATSRRTATLVVAKYLEQTHLVKVGSKLKLTASAGGPATYSWTRNNVPHSGTAATLSLASLSLSTAGTYRGYVSGPGGGPVLAGVFTVVVYDDKPQVTLAQNLPNGTVGKPYSHQIQINTQTRFSPTSYTAAKLPRGVTLNTKTGLISGMPTVAGDYEIIVTATNAFGSHSSQKKTVTITPLHTNLIGTFTGTVARQNVLNDNLGGRVDFTITSTAAISGKLTNGTKSHPFKGQLVTGGAQPMATINVTRSGQSSLELELVFNIGSQSLTLASKVKSGLIEAAVSGWRLKWKAAGAPATLSPKLFTFGLRPPTGMTGIPAGDGYGSFTLPASGLVNITGKTPDGTSFTHSTFVGPQGQIALFKTLHTPTGSLLGTLDIAPIDNGFLDQDVLEGSVSWSRPANAKSRYSPEGFGPITLTAFGGWHKLPDFAPGHVLNMLLDDKAMLTFREGGLATASINPDVPTFDLLLGNKPSLPAALSAGNPGSVRITSLNAKAGTFTGTFILEDTELRTGPAFAGKKLKRTATFSGVFTQDSMGLVGVGHFLLPEMPVDAMAPLPATTPTTTEILSGNLIMEKK